MSASLGSFAYTLAFEISPIMLSGGIAQNIPGGTLPIVALTEGPDLLAGLLSGAGLPTDLEQCFAHFQPMPGGNLVSFEIAKYPFANMAVAANATIMQPLQLSMLMKCPVNGPLGYATRLATMVALQAVLQQHGSTGGTYIVVTPATVRPNGILKELRDVSDGQSKQTEYEYQWDFEFPLLTQQAAQQVQNSLMANITNGTSASAAWSGVGTTTGATAPNTIAGPSVIPSSAPLPAANVSPSTPFSTPGGGFNN